jgi:hypothetical protein
MRVRTTTTVLVAALFITARYAIAQGSLTPPGVPGATLKTLGQVDAAVSGVSNTVVQESADLNAAIAGVSKYQLPPCGQSIPSFRQKTTSF